PWRSRSVLRRRPRRGRGRASAGSRGRGPRPRAPPQAGSAAPPARETGRAHPVPNRVARSDLKDRRAGKAATASVVGIASDALTADALDAGDGCALALAGAGEGGADEIQEERSGPRRARLELGRELACHEPRVVGR